VSIVLAIRLGFGKDAFGTPDRRPRPIGDQRTDQSEAARDVQGNSRHCGKGGANLEEAPGQLKVAGLHADGAVSDEEFKELKTKLIFGTFRRQQSAESSETVPNAPNTYAPSATPTQQEEGIAEDLGCCASG
jgi:hypothetical protein